VAKESRGIHLIAEMAKVSIGTVDRALHGRGGIKESTRQRILQIARQIGYTPNLAARALAVAKASARIGVCMPGNPFSRSAFEWISGLEPEPCPALHSVCEPPRPGTWRGRCRSISGARPKRR
jgi:hypothetical protein